MKLFSVSEQTCDVFGHVSPDLNTETRMKLDVEVKRSLSSSSGTVSAVRGNRKQEGNERFLFPVCLFPLNK